MCKRLQLISKKLEIRMCKRLQSIVRHCTFCQEILYNLTKLDFSTTN